MNRMRGKRLVVLVAVCALSLSLMAAAPVGKEAPPTLLNEQWQSGMVIGNRGGAFAYYAIQYPGDKRVVTIELRHWPGDPATRYGVGFNVYGPNGFVIGHGERMEITDGAGLLQLQYADDNPATWLVQVYNYLPDIRVDYGIVATGLPPLPAPPPPPPPQPWGSRLLGLGYLTGSSSGTFQYFGVTVASSEPDVQLMMNSSPDDPYIAKGVGFVVYGPSGEVTRGHTTSTAGERKVTLAASAPGVYRVQVYNYMPGLTIRYMLTRAPIVN